MKKFTTSLLAALLFALVFTAISNLGNVKVSAKSFTADLDGDGTDETIEYEISGEEYDLKLDYVTINGIAAKLEEDHFDCEIISVSLFNSCTTDKFMEVLVMKSVDNWTVFYLYRYNNGKVTKYCEIEADEIIAQKKKNRITEKDDVYVRSIGNFYVTRTLKVKSGEVVYDINAVIKPNKDNSRFTFKTNRKLTLYSDESFSEKIKTLKNGSKIKIIKFKFDDEGYLSKVCVKSKGVTGWIDTSAFDYSDFIIENPPFWG